MSGLSTKVLKSASTGLAGVAANLGAVFGQSQKSGASVQSLGKHLNGLVNPAGSGGGGGGAAKKLSEEAKEAARQLKEAERAAQKLEDAINRPLVSAIDGFANAIGDFVASGLRDFKKLGQAILNTIVSSISQAIAFAVANPIKIALGLTGGLTGGVAQAATGGEATSPGGGGILGLGQRIFGGGGGGGGLLGGFFGSFGTGQGIAGLAGGTGFLGGIGNVLGGFAQSGFGGAIANIGTALAGATSGLAGLGAAIGAIALPVLAVTAIFSFFKKKVTELDRGIRVTVDGMDTLVETFQTLETKRFWGLSKKVRTTYTEADEDVAAPLQMIVSEIQDSLISAAETLGITSSAFTDFAYQMEVSTRGLSDEEAQRAVQDALEELGDAFAEMVVGIEDVQRVGEGAATTLTRLSTSLLAVNDAMDLLGGTLFDVSLLGGDAASNLVDAFGGADQMAQAVNAYFAAFYSVEEQRETIMRRLNDQFAELGQTMPQSREGFRELIESIDLTTEYGRELYAALVSMAGAMNEVLPQIERFTLSMQGLVSNIGGEIGVLIEQSQALALQSGEQARLWYKTAKTLREFLSDILNSDLTNVSPVQQAALNQSRFDAAFAAAMGGDQSAADKIPELSRNLLKSMKAQSGTLVEYQMQAAAVMNQLKLLAGVADLEGANEDVLQALYERQIEVLTALANFLELESLTPEQIASLDSSIQDLVTNWDATIGEFDAALLSLEAAIRDAEDFSYSQLQERLNVSVNLLAQADIPEYLKQLISTAETGVEAFIDFVVRDDQLTPDQKWLLTNHFSNHFSEIELALSSASSPDALALALRDTFDSLIIFDLVLNPASDKMVRHLATVDKSLHKIGVTVDLSNHPDPLIRALFEYRQSLHEAKVKAIVSDSSDPLALKAVGGKASSIKVNTSLQVATNSDARAVRMASTGPSSHKINVGVDLRGEIHDGVRRMGFSGRSDHRIKTHLDKVGQTDAALLRLGSESRSDHRVKAHLDKVGQTDAALLRLGSSGKTSHRVKTYLDKVGQTNSMILRLGSDDRSNHRIKTSLDQVGGVGSILSRVASGPASQHTVNTSVSRQGTVDAILRRVGASQLSSHLVNTGVDLRGSVHDIVRRVGSSGSSNHRVKATVGLYGQVDRIISRMGASGLTNHLINAGIDLRGDVHTLVRRLGASSGSNHRINTLLALNPASNPLVRMMGNRDRSDHTIMSLLALNQNSNPLVRMMGHYRRSDHTIMTLLQMAPGSDGTLVDVLRRPFSTVTLDMETYFTEQQQHLLDTLLLGPNGTVTIGGQFEFEPSQLFSTWFETTAQDLIMNPMSDLSAMLDELRAAVIADTQQREEELARQAQIANLQRWGMMAENRLEQNLVGAFDAAQAIRDLERETGVHLMTGNQLTDLFMNEDGTINYDATSVAVGPGGNLAAFNAAFRGPNGLEAQLLAANQGITTEGQMVDELARRLMLIGQQASFSVWADFFGQVGAVGPSTPDATPPPVYQSPRREVQMSPITSLALKQQTDSAKESASELKAVRTELAAARKEQEKQSATLLEYQKKISTVLTKFDVVGLPPERT
ncbi:hypothetical protein ACFQFQ_14545 [Sulfitobacter porphyrae]|uniref:Uncharacterized protein n=1 Tax=Sulfitobacter porphyrae TaxID=1246864 RepID=A0ABW2B4W6_9RHOB